VQKRIIGYDLARALAIFGMVVVNFKIVMGAESNGPAWLVSMAELLSGRAAATFVVLAGVGISLLSREGRISGDKDLLRRNRTALLKRALFLFIVGLLFTPIWPADILHFYGLYIASAAMLLAVSTRTLFTLCGALVVAAAVMVLSLNYDHGWDWETLEYVDFWSPSGMVRHLFFNGFHPVIPWLGFLLVGMVLGRQELTRVAVRRRIFGAALATAVVAEVGSRVIVRRLSPGLDATGQEAIFAMFGTQPMPAMPLYMFAATGTACALIVAMVSLGFRYGETAWLRPIVRTGQLALSLYVAHIIVGMGALESFGRLENQTLPFSLLSSLVFCAFGVLFAHLWRGRFKRGPVEMLMRVMT
jgi:uncharacterized protein